MPSRADVKDVLSRLSEPHRAAMQTHYTTQREVGRRADLIAQDDKYQVWLDHLQQLVDFAADRVAKLERDVTAGPEIGEALTAKKLALVDARGEHRGLRQAMDLIPRMIEAGQSAEAHLA